MIQLSLRDKSPLSICFMDINNLKHVNDVYGHKEGGAFIALMCSSVKECLRSSDAVCRTGGDEFLVILPGSTAKSSGLVWKRIMRRFKALNDGKAKPYPISASHGIVEYPASQRISIDEFIALADRKMYREKKKYRQRGVDGR